jgi:hypothetical protein
MRNIIFGLTKPAPVTGSIYSHHKHGFPVSFVDDPERRTTRLLNCDSGGSWCEGDLNEAAASAADATRGIVWQGNCDVADSPSQNRIDESRSIPVEYQ